MILKKDPQVPFSARESSLSDQAGIQSLLREMLGIPEDARTIHPSVLDWKYWGPHPLVEDRRSRVIEDDAQIVAHGGAWPIRLLTLDKTYSAFHLIDWAAKRHVPGAGVQVLRQWCGRADAALIIGGSAMTRRILPLCGFESQNNITLLERPFAPLCPALTESPHDWKMCARVARNFMYYVFPKIGLPKSWSTTLQNPADLSGALWPKALFANQAVSFRSAKLLTHLAGCPEINKSACFLLQRNEIPVAYFFLMQVRNQVRLADYGPAGLDERTSLVLGMAAQSAALANFPDAISLLAATSEDKVRFGWRKAGLRIKVEEPIMMLKLNEELSVTDQFRLTLLDWDLLIL